MIWDWYTVQRHQLISSRLKPSLVAATGDWTCATYKDDKRTPLRSIFRTKKFLRVCENENLLRRRSVATNGRLLLLAASIYRFYLGPWLMLPDLNIFHHFASHSA